MNCARTVALRGDSGVEELLASEPRRPTDLDAVTFPPRPPDEDAVFSELFRVLRPGGRFQIADVTIQSPVSEERRRNIDLWTG